MGAHIGFAAKPNKNSYRYRTRHSNDPYRYFYELFKATAVYRHQYYDNAINVRCGDKEFFSFTLDDSRFSLITGDLILAQYEHNNLVSLYRVKKILAQEILLNAQIFSSPYGWHGYFLTISCNQVTDYR